MEYVKYNNTDITTDIKQPNDNILDNADFRSGIINQQGFNTYMYSNKSMLTIDRWITYGPNVNINTNSITMANRTTSPHTVQQHLYTQYKAGNKLTLYVSAFDITGNVYVYLTGLDNQKKKLVNGDNIFTFTLTSKIDNFFIYLEPNAVASFNCLKLEEGDHFTGMPVWKELEELDKCLPYYCQISGVRALYCERNNIPNGEKSYSFSIPRKNIMVDIPTVTVMGNKSVNSLNGICLRLVNNVGNYIHITGYSFEVRNWEVIIKVFVDGSVVDVSNTDVQLFLGNDFLICLDANTY